MKSVISKPLISIITPFLNLEEFIAEAIESVLEQTYTNWELILVDDGSIDKSTVIAKEYANKYSDKIRYVEHENHQNKGISASRNLGFQRSNGSFIAFLDADDVYLPRKLEHQILILLSQPKAAMLYASTQYWYSWTGHPDDAKRDRIWDDFGTQPNILAEPPRLLTLFLKNTGAVPCMGSLLVRREAIKDIGGWEDSFRDMFEDQIFYAKIISRWPVFVARGCWDKYRQHPNSICHVIEKTGKSDWTKFTYLLWLEKYLSGQGIEKNSELWNVLQNAIWPFRYPFLNSLKTLKNSAFQAIDLYKYKAKQKIKKIIWS